MKAMLFEETAAEAILNLADVPKSLWAFDVTALAESHIDGVHKGDVFYAIGPKASTASSGIIFPLTEDGFFRGVPEDIRTTVLLRCLRAALTTLRPGSFLPRSWASYTTDDLTIFFASTLAMGHEGQAARAILQRHPRQTNHVLLCEYVGSGAPIDLHTYRPSNDAEQALLVAASQFPEALQAPRRRPGQYDLVGMPAHVAIAQEFQYSDWLKLLTSEQRGFAFKAIESPTRLRGAAGTGKTLALTVKALHDLYDAVDNGSDFRCALITHNWGSAEVIRAALRRLDERGVLVNPEPQKSIEIMTLQALASRVLQLNSSGVKPISEDGYEGKVMQLEGISALTEEFAKSDWSMFRKRCSPEFSARIQAPRDTAVARSLAWDLMNEFACVVGAERGLRKEDYVRLGRAKWMMPLPKEGDREVVFILHERFRKWMHEGLRSLTMYDVINDFLRFLDGNMWDVRRRVEGFDLLLVDEFHLFNKQEILVFQYLMRRADDEQHVVVALDPRQSPADTFLGFGGSAAAKAPMFTTKGATIQLDTVFRYTFEINAVIECLEEFWFGFELPEEWGSSKRRPSVHGPVPSLQRTTTVVSSIDNAIRLAERLSSRPSGGGTAVLCLSDVTFQRFHKHVALLGKSKGCRVIRSRDDTEMMAGLGHRYVISQPEYVAGLQFDSVIIPDANDELAGTGLDQQLAARRLLSGLYLAISRARSELHAFAADEASGLLRYLKPAVNAAAITVA